MDTPTKVTITNTEGIGPATQVVDQDGKLLGAVTYLDLDPILLDSKDKVTITAMLEQLLKQGDPPEFRERLLSLRITGFTIEAEVINSYSAEHAKIGAAELATAEGGEGLKQLSEGLSKALPKWRPEANFDNVKSLVEYTTLGEDSISKAIDALVFMIRDKRPSDKELFTYVPQTFMIRQKNGWIARVKGQWIDDKPKLNETGKGVGEAKNDDKK